MTDPDTTPPRLRQLVDDLAGNPLLDALLGHSSQFVVVCDPAGTVVATNGTERFGMSLPGPLEGAAIWELPKIIGGRDLPAERVIGAKERFRLLRAGEEVEPEVVYHYETERGDYWLRLRMVPVREEGELLGVVVTGDDVRTEQIAIKELSDASAVFRSLVESLPQMFWSASTTDGADYFAPRWYAFTGRPPEQLQGNRWRELIHPDDRDRTDRAVAAALGSDTPAPIHYRLRRADGEYRWVETQARPVRDEDGNLVRMIGTTLDVSDRFREQEKRREEHEFLRAVLSLSRMGTYSWAMRDERFEADDRFFDITGADRALRNSPEVLVRYYENRVHPDDRDRVGMRFTEVRDLPGGRFEQEYRILVPGEGGDEEVRWVGSMGRVEFDEHGPVRIIGVVTDITERKQSEDAHIRAQKAQAMGTLVSGIAHDVGNVAGAILTYARIAQQEVASGKSPAGSLDEIARGALHAAEIVQRLMSFGKHDGGEMAAVRVPAVIDDAVALVRPSLSGAQSLRIEIAEDLPDVLGDATQLSQVLVNLLSNAVQAIDGGGAIVVSATEQPSAGLQPRPDRSAVCLRIEDDGPGLSDQVMADLWTPFFTTKPQGEGTGLGLPVVQHLIERHGGTITASNRPAGGARFEILLPTAGATSVAEEPEQATGAAAHHGHVLFVDDSEALVRAATRAMPYRGFTVSGHTDPVEALAEFTGDPEAVSILITDLSMPGLTGLQLIAKTRELRPDLPVIMTSGFVGPDEDADAAVDALVPKPCSIDDLAAVATRLLAERS